MSRWKSYTWKVVLLGSLLAGVVWFPVSYDTPEENRWFVFQTSPPVTTTASLTEDPKHLLRVYLDLSSPTTNHSYMRGTLRAYLPAARWTAQAAEERFDFLLGAFAFVDWPPTNLTSAGAGAGTSDISQFEEDYTALILEPTHPDDKAISVAFAPLPFVTVSSKDLPPNRLERFGMPQGRMIIDSKTLEFPSLQRRGTRWFPFEKYEINICMGLFGYPGTHPIDYPFHLRTIFGEWGSYYPLEIHARGQADWRFQLTGHARNPPEKPYFITDDYIHLIVTRPLPYQAYAFIPLLSLLGLSIWMLFRPKNVLKEGLLGEGVAFLLGLVAVRSVVVPRDIIDSGILTLYDIITLSSILLVVLSMAASVRFVDKHPHLSEQPRENGTMSGKARKRH